MLYIEHINRNGTYTYLSTTLLSEKKSVCPKGQITLLLIFKYGLKQQTLYWFVLSLFKEHSSLYILLINSFNTFVSCFKYANCRL